MNSENDNAPLEGRLLQLLESVRDNGDGNARAELNTLLRKDAAARAAMARLMVDEQALISRLRDDSIVALLEPGPAQVTRPGRFQWFAWRPLAAAAAGLAIGLFSASMVFAYGMPKVVRQMLTLANAGFEEPVAPLAEGIPLRYGIWSGDYAELVGAQQGIVPREGTQMFRFLRTDSKLPSTGPALNGNMYQLIDARPWRDAISSGTAVADWSVWFNCVKENAGAQSKFEASVWAFAGDPSFVRKNWQEKLHQELAYSSWRVAADDDPQSWQRVAGSMIVPPDTDFLVIEIKAFPGTQPVGNGAVIFTGHYADDVQLVLRTDARRNFAKATGLISISESGRRAEAKRGEAATKSTPSPPSQDGGEGTGRGGLFGLPSPRSSPTPRVAGEEVDAKPKISRRSQMLAGIRFATN